MSEVYEQYRAAVEDIKAVGDRLVATLNERAEALPDYKGGKKAPKIEIVRRAVETKVLESLAHAMEGLTSQADLEEALVGESEHVVETLTTLAVMSVHAVCDSDDLEQMKITVEAREEGD